MGHRDRLLRSCRRDRFVVTLKSGEAFDGLLSDVDAATLVLVDAFAMTDQNRHKVDGSLYLARADVAYMQKPGDRA